MASSKRREEAQQSNHRCPVLLRDVAQRVSVLWTQKESPRGLSAPCVSVSSHIVQILFKVACHTHMGNGVGQKLK